MASCACCSSSIGTPNEIFIDPEKLLEKCPLDNKRQNFRLAMIREEVESFRRVQLQGLPIELYQACLQYLDVRTLTDLRRVSQYTRAAISTLYQYEEIYKNAPQALRACLVTGVASRLPLLRLHDSLTTMECYFCETSDPPMSTFGTHLSLFSGHRTCTFCLRNNPLLRPVEFKALMALALARNSTITVALSEVPFLKTIPGRYSPSHITHYKSTSLFLGSSITVAPGQQLTEKEARILKGSSRAAVINHHPFAPPSSESDISPQSADNYHSPTTPFHDSLCYATAISYPYLVPSKSRLDPGVHCEECNLHLLWVETLGKRLQEAARRNFQDPTATVTRRNIVNRTRMEASKIYGTSEECVLNSKRRGMSLKEHAEMHLAQVLSASEIKFRAELSTKLNSGTNNPHIIV